MAMLSAVPLARADNAVPYPKINPGQFAINALPPEPVHAEGIPTSIRLLFIALALLFTYRLCMFLYQCYTRWQQGSYDAFHIHNRTKILTYNNTQTPTPASEETQKAAAVAYVHQHQTMSEAEVVRTMRDHLEGLFPKSCPDCQHRYATFREFLQTTKPIGAAIPYDAELGDWHPLQPVGVMTYATCQCGTTLSLGSAGMPLTRLWALLHWAKNETRLRNKSPRELISYLRDEINKQVLATPDTTPVKMVRVRSLEGHSDGEKTSAKAHNKILTDLIPFDQ